MPPLEVGEHLISYLFEVGPTMAAGMGDGPITFGELESWQNSRGFRLQPWEAQFIRNLSLEYLVESHAAEKQDCPIPWVPDFEDPPVLDLGQVARGMKASIRLLAGRSG